MKVKNKYPEWAEKFRGPGRTIRKTKSGYALYRCTSKYVKGGHPKTVQEYLGRITEEEGFVPKISRSRTPEYIEYGLSSFIYKNFKRDIQRNTYQFTDDLIRICIVNFIFGSFSLFFLNHSSLTCGDAKRLNEYALKISSRRINNGTKCIDKIIRNAFPDDEERTMLIEGLKLCVAEKGQTQMKARPPKEIQKIIERTDYSYGQD
jgi:hypothetical protein